jgi:hypothetical protein
MIMQLRIENDICSPSVWLVSWDRKDWDNKKKCIWLKRQRYKNKFVSKIIFEWIYILSKHEV